MTMIGSLITCTVTFLSINPDIGVTVTVKANDVLCRVIDDRLSTVGTPDSASHPILVDCLKEIEWLNPIDTDGVFLFNKEDGDCDYGTI